MEHIVGHPRARIPDLDFDHPVCLFGGYIDGAGVACIFDGIANQVGNGAGQQIRGCDDTDLRIDADVDSVSRCRLPSDGRLGDRKKVDTLQLDGIGFQIRS